MRQRGSIERTVGLCILAVVVTAALCATAGAQPSKVGYPYPKSGATEPDPQYAVRDRAEVYPSATAPLYPVGGQTYTHFAHIADAARVRMDPWGSTGGTTSGSISKALRFYDNRNDPAVGPITYTVLFWREGDTFAVSQTVSATQKPNWYTVTVNHRVDNTGAIVPLDVDVSENLLTSGVYKPFHWRVDVTQNGVTTTGDVWTFYTALGQPCPESRRVGVHVIFVWDEHPRRPAGTYYENVHVKQASDSLPWIYNGAFIYQRKSTAPYAPGTVPNTVRFMRSEDSGYPNNGRLASGTSYLWRISYHDRNNGFLGWADTEDTGTVDASAGWPFMTVPAIPFNLYGTGENWDTSVESVVVFYENQYGTLVRDPEENDVDFRPLADYVKRVHEACVTPDQLTDTGIQTRVYGTQEILASYDSNRWGGSVGTVFPTWTGSDSRSWGVNDSPLYPGSTGWFTDERDGYHYIEPHDWRVSKAIRGMLYDMGTGPIAGTTFYYPNLKYVLLLGDVKRVAASYFFNHTFVYDDSHRGVVGTLPSDLFYSAIDFSSLNPPASLAPRFQVSRIPLRQARYQTTDPDGYISFLDEQEPTGYAAPGAPDTTWVPGTPTESFRLDQTPYRYPYTQFDAFAYPDLDSYITQHGNSDGYLYPFPYPHVVPSLFKLGSYARNLKSPTDKDNAYKRWFGRVVFAAGSSGYRQWFQFYSAVTQYILNQSLANGTDYFNGLLVRTYDFFGLDKDDAPPGVWPYEEGLRISKVFRHLKNVADNVLTASATYHVGFVYFLGRGYDDFFLDSTTIAPPWEGSYCYSNCDLEVSPLDNFVWPYHQKTVPRVSIKETDFSLTDGGNVVDWRRPGENKNDDWRRPVLVASAPYGARVDSALNALNDVLNWNRYTWARDTRSVGESMFLSPTGPVAVLGYASANYASCNTYPLVSTQLNDPRLSDDTPDSFAEEDGGYIVPQFQRGVLNLQPQVVGTTGTELAGKVEFVKIFAKQYTRSVNPHLGNLLNDALQEYITLHQAQLTAGSIREVSTLLGVQLFGDSATSLPQRQTVSNPYTGFAVADNNPREATIVGAGSGAYGAMPQYNMQDMPIHSLPRTTDGSGEPTGTVDASIRVQTNSPYVRVKVMTPFNQNSDYVPGYWYLRALQTTDPRQDGTNPDNAGIDVYKTVDQVALCTFTLRTPSIYIVTIQEQNPKWTAGANPENAYEWRWLKSNCIYLQVVNTFIRKRDAGDNNIANILVVDVDQRDRYNLTIRKLGPVTESYDVESYYVTPGYDGRGYNNDLTQPVPAWLVGLGAGWDPSATMLPPAPSPLGTAGLLVADRAIPPWPQHRGDPAHPGFPDHEIAPILPWLNAMPNNNPAPAPQEKDKYTYQYWCTNVYHTESRYGDAVRRAQQYYGDLSPDGLFSFQESRGTVMAFTGEVDNNLGGIRKGAGFVGANGAPDTGVLVNYNYVFDAAIGREAQFIKRYMDNGGRFWLTGPGLLRDVALRSQPSLIDLLTNGSYFGAINRTLDTDWTELAGDQDGTLSEGLTHNGNLTGGDGMNNNNPAVETDPNSLNASIIFKWMGPAGTGTSSGQQGAATQNRLVASGGRALLFNFPMEALDHFGEVLVDDSGRKNMMRLGMDWLRSVPVASNPDPAHNAQSVKRDKVLQWSRVAEARSYNIYLWADNNPTAVLTASIDRDNPFWDPSDPENPTDPLLEKGKAYSWRVDCVNVDDTTPGPVWKFTTVTDPPQALNPVPASAHLQVPVNQVMQWTVDSRVDFYNVYQITTTSPATGARPATPAYNDPRWVMVDSNNTIGSCNKLVLNKNLWFFWRVDSVIYELGNPPSNPLTTQGTIWNFATLTPPGKPRNPQPANAAISVPTNKTLSWEMLIDPNTNSYNTDAYDVFIWSDNPTPPPANDTPQVTDPRYAQCSGSILHTGSPQDYVPGGLTPNTTYYWQVRPKNNTAFSPQRQNVVDTWSFSVGPTIVAVSAPTNPNPANGAIGVGFTPTLQWTRGTGATSHDVQFVAGGTTYTATVNGPDNLVLPSPPAPLTAGATYTWQVTAKNSISQMAGAWWSFRVGADPVDPTTMNPPANAIDIATTYYDFTWGQALGAIEYWVYVWVQGQPVPNPGDPTAYKTTHPVTTIRVPGLTPGTKYFWRVDCHTDSSAGGSAVKPGATKAAASSNPITVGPVLPFTTVTASGYPDPVSLITPADQATGVSPTPTFSWHPAIGAVTYTLTVTNIATGAVAISYTTTPANPPPDPITYVPATPLQMQTRYSVQIDGTSSGGNTTYGKGGGGVQNPQGTFTTQGIPPGPPTNLLPANGATAVALQPTLSWGAGTNAVSYDVYLGIVNPPTTLAGNVVPTQFIPAAPLAATTTYYWQVFSVALDGTRSAGSGVWSFTTGTAPPTPVTVVNPANGATSVAANVTLTWTAVAGATSYNVYLGTTNPPPQVATGVAVAQYKPPASLAASTAYYWRVDSVNAGGSTAGTVTRFTVAAPSPGPTPNPSGGGGGGGWCFIATSGYELPEGAAGGASVENCTGVYRISSERLQQLDDIRGMRDAVLVRMHEGQAFTAWYYALSPYAATAVRHNEPAKSALRAVLLDPLSNLSKACVDAER